MIEYTVVQEAPMFPMACFCGATKGPFVDTHHEISGRHVYICKLCVKRGARPFAFMPGAQVDRLENAAVELEQKEAELQAAHERAEQQVRDIAERDRMIRELQETLTDYRGMVVAHRHLAAQIRTQAEELQAVGATNGDEP